jgi:hypothetical protein
MEMNDNADSIGFEMGRKGAAHGRIEGEWKVALIFLKSGSWSVYG